jgi:hypothetical protein
VAAAVFGLIGVIIGGVINFVATVYQQNRTDRSARHAIARLTYDDFLRYQSTLVRALAAGTWWPDSSLLKTQTSVADRKVLLGDLDDGTSQDVADAQGWMEYLIQVRKRAGTRGPSEIELELMRDNFCRLDHARWQLSGSVSGRRFRSFVDGATLKSLDHYTTLELLGISDEDCRCRRELHYGRGEDHGTS